MKVMKADKPNTEKFTAKASKQASKQGSERSKANSEMNKIKMENKSHVLQTKKI